MRKLLLAGALLFLSLAATAQTVASYQLLPAVPTINSDLKLVLYVTYGNCSRSLDYSVTRTGNALAIRGCFMSSALTVPCAHYDTIRLGRLPAGTYTVSCASYLANQAADCASSTLLWFGSNATTSFTVGLALATRNPAAQWQFFPTVLSAASSTLHLTGTSAPQQVSIYDLAGREQVRFDAAQLLAQRDGIQLSIPPLAPALYLLRIVDQAGQTSAQRFIRQ